MQQTDSEYGRIPVRYERIERVDGYVVGIMRIDDTSGSGRPFEFRVKGTEEQVMRYAEGAVIRQLELRMLGPEDDPLAELEESIVERRRAAWDALPAGHREAVYQLSEGRSVDLAADVLHSGTRVGLELLASGEPLPVAEFDLARGDRLCEIEALGLEGDVEFYLQFQIDPTVSAGRRDVYAPTHNSTDASASLTCTGNANLYLTRGGVIRDLSLKPANQDESVYSSGGGGAWRVHVYGATAATYELSSGWIYKRNRAGAPG